MSEDTGRVTQKVQVDWEEGRRYRGGVPDGPTHLMDGDGEAAPSPVAATLIALAACSAIDVVEILEKRRTPPRALSVEAEYERASGYPRRVVSVHLAFTIEGDGIGRAHAERAVELSFGKYCSVAATFAPDTEMTWQLRLNGEPGSVMRRIGQGAADETVPEPDPASAGGP